MAERIETYAVTWQDIPVTITYEANWLGLCAHLQLRAGERLPITETGYRSIYTSEEAIDRAGGAVAFAMGLLDEAAALPAWKRYWQERQQLSLF